MRRSLHLDLLRAVKVSIAAIPLLLSLWSCDGEPPQPSPSTGPTGTASCLGLKVSTSACHCPLECHIKGEMQTYYFTEAKPLVEEYFKSQYKQMPVPKNYWFLPTGTTKQSGCAGTEDDKSYEYCATDDSIYIGQELLWQLYSAFGAAGPIVGLAHEWGHHVQAKVGVPFPTTNAETVNHENQADCIAGAWVNYADSKNYIEYPKDLVNIDTLFVALGDAEGPAQTHGTPKERVRSFELGHSEGLRRCNDFYPATPVLG